MLDSDLAMLFGYETKQLNRQVLRNIKIDFQKITVFK